MSNNGLKPCRICGGEARFELAFTYPGPRAVVRCKKCGRDIGPYIFHEQDINWRIYREGEAPTCRHAIRRARHDWNRRNA